MSVSAPTVSLSLHHSKRARTHDERALDTTIRRFPTLLRIAREYGWGSFIVRSKVDDRYHAIIAEYRRVVGKRS